MVHHSFDDPKADELPETHKAMIPTGMTKADLIAAIKDYPDHARVVVVLPNPALPSMTLHFAVQRVQKVPVWLHGFPDQIGLSIEIPET